MEEKPNEILEPVYGITIEPGCNVIFENCRCHTNHEMNGLLGCRPEMLFAATPEGGSEKEAADGPIAPHA